MLPRIWGSKMLKLLSGDRRMKAELIGCEKCGLKDCPILNKAECPINTLWAETLKLDEAKARLIAEAERIVSKRN